MRRSSYHAAWLTCALLATAAGQMPSPVLGKRVRPLAAADGWTAVEIHRSDACVGYVHAGRIYREGGAPEVVALDDRGRCTVLARAGGKWTARHLVEDGDPVGAFAHGDLDRRSAAPEVYVGTRTGTLYRAVARPSRGFDVDVILRTPGVSFTKIVLDDLLPSRTGLEMIVFTTPGPAYHVEPDPRTRDAFVATRVATLPGRVRSFVVLPPRSGVPPRVAAVFGTGEVILLTLTDDGLERTTILAEPMELARVDRRRVAPGEPETLYVGRDDGVILRLAELPAGGWKREIIYAGPVGPRGIVAGRFHADPATESVAVFGYSGKVQLLSRTEDGPWRVETVFRDTERGHWLTAIELDGRNVTDELVGCGFSNRVFLLTRAPGYGLPGVPTDSDPDAPVRRDGGSSPRDREQRRREP